jgi:hypothetical protein
MAGDDDVEVAEVVRHERGHVGATMDRDTTAWWCYRPIYLGMDR